MAFLFAQRIADEIEILRIGVLPSLRRHGYAGALIIALEKSSKPSDKIFLEVRESNDEAISLYIKHGFTKIAAREKCYNNPVEDAHIYHKEKRV